MLKTPRYMVALMSTTPRLAPTVKREGESAVVTAGELTIHMHIEDLRDLCNDMAEVLDGWYEERDRLGATNERA